MTEAIQRAPSVARMLADRVAATPGGEAFRWPVAGADGTESWESMTWARTGERVTELAAGLLALGLRPEQRVVVYSATRIEWVLADLAINTAGGATTTIYPSSQPEDVLHIASDSGAVIAFVEDETKAALLRELADKTPDLGYVVLLEGAGSGTDRELSLDDLAERGRVLLADTPDAVDTVVAGIAPDHLATLIYTSGTTGRPKGVELTQDNWTYEGAAVDRLGILRPDDLQYLWLPLSHSFGKVLLAAQLQIGVVAAVEAEGGIKATLFDRAFRTGRKWSAVEQQGRRPGPALRVSHAVADKVVLSKLRERFGGRIRLFVSGSAALSRDIAEWFHAAGMLIVEGYGMTESSAATAVNLPGRFRFGTVGPALPGTELRIADDGELLIRGPGVMRGYHGLPEATAEALDADGWLHTGDIGELDADGFLKITDRKKDMIKTSGGKFVAPQPIEVTFPVICGLASQFVVHGDGRNYVTALVTLDPDALAQWAESNGVAERDPAALARRDDVRAVVAAGVKQLNAGLNRWETIKDFRILDHDLTIEAGELTPSLKLKRRVVERRYKAVLDEMYAANDRSRV